MNYMISVWNLEGWSDCKLRRLKKENFTKDRISSVKHLNPPSTDSKDQMYETALSRVMSKGRGVLHHKEKSISSICHCWRHKGQAAGDHNFFQQLKQLEHKPVGK